ncbi:MAG: hypothetical protein H6622_04495 [Halobacteriovoraceae bacterium]|nr:hypothetical protein [Halobacteriovoraceae bacterium]
MMSGLDVKKYSIFFILAFFGLLNSCQVQNEINSSKKKKNNVFLTSDDNTGKSQEAVPEAQSIDLWLEGCHLQIINIDYVQEFKSEITEGNYPSPIELCEDSEYKTMALEVYDELIEVFLVDTSLLSIQDNELIEDLIQEALRETVCTYRPNICAN